MGGGRYPEEGGVSGSGCAGTRILRGKEPCGGVRRPSKAGVVITQSTTSRRTATVTLEALTATTRQAVWGGRARPEGMEEVDLLVVAVVEAVMGRPLMRVWAAVDR